MSPLKYSFVNDESNAGEQVDILSIQENGKLGKMTEDGNQSSLNVQTYISGNAPSAVPALDWQVIAAPHQGVTRGTAA